jgi:CheY-like chemotaxis protein
MPPQRTVRVLLVEDHPADITLTRKAFARISTPNQLDVVFDGVEAMRFLRRQGRYVNAERPDLVLLDLNMPRMDGREVLEQMGLDPTLRRIPVVVLTTSASPNDVEAAYKRCANSYLTKPVGFDQFLRLIEDLERYWFNTAHLPP